MTIGERNNNPLNIRRSAANKWRGEKKALPQRGQLPVGSGAIGEGSARRRTGEGAFCSFTSVSFGLRAAFCILRTYRNKYKAVCIEDIITRWAPPTENDTRKYICDLCRLTGFGGRERLTESDWPKLVRAMALLESGMKLSEETVNEAYKLYKQN